MTALLYIEKNKKRLISLRLAALKLTNLARIGCADAIGGVSEKQAQYRAVVFARYCTQIMLFGDLIRRGVTPVRHRYSWGC